jgi:hypothetical protein
MADKRPIRFDTANIHSVENAYFCGILALLAYKSPPEIEKELLEFGYYGNSVSSLKTHLTSCLILRWDDVTAIAFRGTVGWRQRLNNANVWAHPTPYGRIHGGFLHTVEHIGPIIYQSIYPDILAGKRLVLTGHERGGALATLFAFFLACRKHKVSYLTTFSPPKVGDQEFESNLSSCYRSCESH